MGTDPLDFDGLVAELDNMGGNWHGLPAGTTVGHIHLHVNDLDQAQRFYCDILGFDLVLRYGSSALFVSVGGYHHHIGLNTWAGVGAPPPPANSVGLRFFTVEISGTGGRSELVGRLQRAGLTYRETENDLSVSDPAGNAIFLSLAGNNG